MNDLSITYRETVTEHDLKSVREILESSGFFSADEADVAVELVEDRLTGRDNDYDFLFAEQADRVIGYTCFGRIPCTLTSYDLYWIAVHKDFQRYGIGRELLTRSEAIIAASGGTRIYIETASRDQYKPTRGFYLRCGYREEVVLEDFYAPGDGKVIYVKVIQANPTGDHQDADASQT